MVPHISALSIGIDGQAIEYYKTQVCSSGFLSVIAYNDSSLFVLFFQSYYDKPFVEINMHVQIK